MKNLYVIKNDNNIKVVFNVVEVCEETETEYIVNTDLGALIKNTGFNFPKDKINVYLPKGFVTDDINNKELKKQLERIYNYLDETHKDYIEHHTMCKKINDEWYNACLKEIEEIKKEQKK